MLPPYFTSLLIVFFVILMTFQLHSLIKGSMFLEGMESSSSSSSSSSLNGSSYYPFTQPNDQITYPSTSSSTTTLNAEQTTEAIKLLMNNSTFLYKNLDALPGIQNTIQGLSSDYENLSAQVNGLAQTTGTNAQNTAGGQPLTVTSED